MEYVICPHCDKEIEGGYSQQDLLKGFECPKCGDFIEYPEEIID